MQVNNNPQVFLTLSGHYHPSPNLGVARLLSNNSGNKAVLQVLSDFEDYTTEPSGNTDTGYLRKIILDPDNKKITVKTYSPTYAAVPWLTDSNHQFSYDAAFLPQSLGTTLSPIFVTDAATCTSAGYTQGFDGVPGPTGTALPLGWTIRQVGGTGATFSDAKPIEPVDIAGATSADQTVVVADGTPSGTWGSQAANASSGTGRALASNPGSNGAGVIQLKIINGTGEAVPGARLSYDLNVLWGNANDNGSELPGYSLFWSKTGGTAAADWTKLGEDRTAGTKAWDLTFPAPLSPGADLYLRWADDNVSGPGGEGAAEDVWSIDNVRVTMAISGPSNLYWSGTVNGVWDVSTTANFTGSPSDTFDDGDDVTFNDTGSRTTITIAAGGVAPGSIVFSNTAATDYSFSGGPIRGATSVLVSGGGHVAISSANTYFGGTVVNHGTLEVASCDALPAGGSLTVGTRGTVVLSSGLSVAAAAVPEPGSIALLAAALAGLAAAAYAKATEPSARRA